SRMSCPTRRVHEDDEKEERQGKQTRPEARLNPRHQAQRGRDEASTYKVRPEHMPRNPPRYDGRNGCRQCEMFGTEGREWRRIEKGPEQNQLVKSSCFLPIAAKKDRDQPDCKNRSTDGIRPNHGVRNCDERRDREQIHRATGHDDSLPLLWTLVL